MSWFCIHGELREISIGLHILDTYVDKCISSVMVKGHHDLEAEILWPY